MNCELCAQIDRIGLKKLIDEWVTLCARNKLSGQSAKKYMDAIQDPSDFAIASVEIAALVDVGDPLIKETYTSESDQPMVFTAYKVFTGLNDLFAHGVNAFEAAGGLTCLHVRAEEAAGIMEEVVVSSTVSNIYVIVMFSTYLSCML